MGPRPVFLKNFRTVQRTLLQFPMLLLLGWCALLPADQDLWAQQDVPTPAAVADTTDESTSDSRPPLTAIQIQERLAALEGAGLNESDKRDATESYQAALSAINLYTEKHDEVTHYEGLIAQYPQDLEEFTKLLSTLPPEVPDVDDGRSIADLEKELALQEQALKKLRDDLDKSNSQSKARSDWLANLPNELDSTQLELEKVRQQIEELLSIAATGIPSEARRIALETRRAALEMALNAIERKREYFTSSPDLVQIRRDYRAKKVAQDEKYLEALRAVIIEQRRAEANQQASATASAAAVERPEAIAALATANAALAKDSAEVVGKIAALTDELTATKALLEEVREAKKLSEERVAAAGLTEASGQQLRQQLELLPNTRGIARRISRREADRADATYSKYRLVDQRNEVEDADPKVRIEQILQQVPSPQREAAERDLKTLLDAEHQILNTADDNYDKYVHSLIELSAKEEELLRTTRDYRNFIAEHVLWIRSCSWPRLVDLEPAARGFAWSWNPVNWREAFEAFKTRSGRSPAVLGLFVFVILMVWHYQRKTRNRLRAIGEQAAKRTCSEYLLSLEALWTTILLALPWPALLGFVGWWIDSPQNESEFVRALAVSSQFSAICLLLLEFVRHACRAKGLADAHFNWPQSALEQVRRYLRWLIGACLPLVLWLTGLTTQNVEPLWNSSLGRIWFVAVMLVLTFACYRFFLWRRSPFRQLLLSKSDSGVSLFQKLWSLGITLLPLFLAVLAVVGYYYTAQQLSLRLLQSAGMILALLVAGGMTKRWILLNRRRLAREQAKQKRLAAATLVATASEEAPPLPPEALDETVDLAALGEQTSKLLVSVLTLIGLVSAWFIWQDMLPALTYIGQWPVFPREGVQNQLTWGDLLQFALLVIVTFVTVRNVPALLDFAVLQHLPMDSGSRYAVTSICRYSLVAIGMVTAYKSLGFDGTSIQWLVAAMGVGLGFGLQEIFANFVSGIILLFERPIRVGDVVTLGDKTGQVSRIRMRATTIVDWDHKEYIVPNKDLVTERLLNWTLSDQTNRIVVNVGVAYGTDTTQACQLLREVADAYPLVLKDPEPIAVFEGFGESTLNLSLRVFLASLEKRLQAIHDLHTAINEKFQAAGIEIAFPQTDIHIRSVPKRR